MLDQYLLKEKTFRGVFYKPPRAGNLKPDERSKKRKAKKVVRRGRVIKSSKTIFLRYA